MAGGVRTDGLGDYSYDIGYGQYGMGVTVTATATDYRPGLLPERDPPMRQLSVKDRREIADVSDLAFDPVPLPSDCDAGVVRFDLVAVPSARPKR